MWSFLNVSKPFTVWKYETGCLFVIKAKDIVDSYRSFENGMDLHCSDIFLKLLRRVSQRASDEPHAVALNLPLQWFGKLADITTAIFLPNGNGGFVMISGSLDEQNIAKKKERSLF